MPQVGEGISIGMPAVDDPDKCPICFKKEHETTRDKKEGKGELKSIPSNLGCEVIPQHPDVAFYSTAAHHLIPAKQCLARFHRLSQMADVVGYNVNAKINGLSLPTVGQLNQNSYYLEGRKYGDLVMADKKEVAFEVMDHVNSLRPKDSFGAQWHVGHHDWSFKTVAQLVTDTDDIQHLNTNYQTLINEELRKLERNLVSDSSVCEEDDDGERGKKVKEGLDEISQKVRRGIRKWKKYYVSAMSFQYAMEKL